MRILQTPVLERDIMTLSHKHLARSYEDILQHHRVYAGTTIHFNGRLEQHLDRNLTASVSLSLVEQYLRNLFYQLDRAYHQTPDVIDRISAKDRFHALVVVEKVGTATHVHIAWHLKDRVSLDDVESWTEEKPDSIDGQLLSRRICEELNVWRRKQFILTNLNNTTVELSAEDADFLQWMTDQGERPVELGTAKSVLNGCSVLSRGVFDPAGWIRYITKEAHWKPGFANQVFFADGFFSEEQRTEDTRYFTYTDRAKRGIIINLDQPLRPRR